MPASWLRLGLLLTGLLALPAGFLSGCAPLHTPSTSAAATSSPVERLSRAQQALDDFVAAARRGDADAVSARVSARDQAFAGRARVWAENLDRVPWSRLSWTARPAHSAVAPDRRDPLGDSAWVQEVEVSWALPGEHRAADQELWLTFVDEPTSDGSGSTTLLAGDTDGPNTRAALPLWLQQPVRLWQHDDVLVLTNADDAHQWLAQATAAQRAVASGTSSGESGQAGNGTQDDPLVVEVPQSRTVFERTLGVPPGSYAGVAAATWPTGADTSSAPVHVVVNPEPSRRLSTLGRNVLLVHEAVHVATRSPGSRVPTWLVEGYADQIAYQAHPAGRGPAEKAVRAYVREHGAPSDWPADDDFAAEASDLDLSYDLAWTAARSIADAYGDAALARFYAALADGDSVDEAAERLGTSPSSLRRQWQRDLRALAGR